MRFFSFKKNLLSIFLLLGVASQVEASSWLSFFFIQEALHQMSSGTLFQSKPLSSTPPSMPVTLGTAELLNDHLPLETPDGFAFLQVRAPAAAALEIKAQSPREEVTPEQLDRAWGPGLIQLFCQSPTSTLWGRWIAIGGSVGLEVVSPKGVLIRHYSMTKTDCIQLGYR